eukprot:962256_1
MRKTASNEREFAWNTVTFWRRSNSVPKFTVALNNYATMLHHQLRRYCEAEKYYLRALRIDNCYSRAHFNYANLCREHINFDLAVLLIPPVTGDWNWTIRYYGTIATCIVPLSPTEVPPTAK